MRHRLSRAGLLLLSALVAAAPAAGAQSSGDQIERPEVTDLNFTGVESVDEDLLRESIATDESHCRSALLLPLCWISHSPYWYEREYLDRTELARDLLRIQVFYWRRGFRQADADSVVKKTGDDKVSVTLKVTEGPPTILSDVTVVGAESVVPERAERRVTSLAGEPFDLLALDSAIVALREALWDEGYADAVITDTTGIIAGQPRAELVVAVAPGPRATVDSIVVLGNEQISDESIRNSLALREGEIFHASEVTLSQRNLYQSQLFKSAVVTVPAQQDSSKVVLVDVVEAPTHGARIAGGVSTLDFAQVEGSWTDYNFLGGARNLTFRAVVGNLLARQLEGSGPFLDVTGLVRDTESPDPYLRPNWQLSADFTQPWFHDYRNSFGAGAFWRRRSSAGVFVDRGYGANVTFTRQVATQAPLSLTYQFEVTKLDHAGDVYFCVILGVCEEETIVVLSRDQRLSPLTLSINVIRTNDLFSPSTGWRADAALEHASAFTLSDFRYNRARAEGAVYRSVGRMVLAGHARVGLVRALSSTAEAIELGPGREGPIVHPRKRFFAGGARSVRGFVENQLGPRVLTLAIDSTSALHEPCVANYDAGACGALLADVDATDFTARPVGGNSIVEGSIELRFPLWGDISGAAFVDGALVGNGDITAFAEATGAVTPGVGIRYATPVGPVRVDLGYRPDLTQTLFVYTDVTGADGRSRLVRIGKREYNANAGRSFLDRLVLHFSIGQAF